MAMREYVGARYVPVFADPTQWDITLKYEPLTVVTNNGASYVSRRYVPEGIQLNNTDYWILWADYNAQLQHYIDQVDAFDGRIDSLEDALPIASFDDVDTVEAAITAIDTRTDAIEDALPISAFDNVNTVDSRLDGIENVLPLSAFDNVNTVDKRLDDIEAVLPLSAFDTVNTVDKRLDDAEGDITNISGSLSSKAIIDGIAKGELSMYTSGGSTYATIKWYVADDDLYSLQLKLTAPTKAELYHFYPGGYALLMTFTTT